MKSDSLPNIRPASNLRTKFTDIMRELAENDEPIFFTQKGQCNIVAMGVDTFNKYELTEAALLESFVKKVNAKLPTDEVKMKDIYCSFCGKNQSEVERMIVGPGCNICNECVEICVGVLETAPDDDEDDE